MLLLEEKIIIYPVVVLLAAVQLNWQKICFLGEVLAVTFNVLFKHSYIISQMLRKKLWILFSLLKNVGRMHQNEPSDLKCSRNSFSVHCNFAGFYWSQSTKDASQKTWAGWAALKNREMGSCNNTDCTAFCTLEMPRREKCMVVQKIHLKKKLARRGNGHEGLQNDY